MSPNGQTLLYRVDDPVRARDIYTMPLAGDKTPRPFLTTEFDELTPRFSPDGQWIAYVSNESGRDEVYLRPFPGPGGRALVSSGGGEEPVWSRDGRRIFYRSADAVVAASVSLAGNPAVTARDTIVTGPFLSSRFHPMYDVAPDGKRLLMLQGAATPVLTVVLNWADGLAAIVGAKK